MRGGSVVAADARDFRRSGRESRPCSPVRSPLAPGQDPGGSMRATSLRRTSSARCTESRKSIDSPSGSEALRSGEVLLRRADRVGWAVDQGAEWNRRVPLAVLLAASCSPPRGRRQRAIHGSLARCYNPLLQPSCGADAGAVEFFRHTARNQPERTASGDASRVRCVRRVRRTPG